MEVGNTFTITDVIIPSAHVINSSLVLTMPAVTDGGSYYCNLSSPVSAYEEVMSQVALVAVPGKGHNQLWKIQNSMNQVSGVS